MGAHYIRSEVKLDGSRDRLVRKGDYVHGSFFKPETVDGYINGVNPGDRLDVLGRFPFSESSVDEAVDYASLGQRIWRHIPLPKRAEPIGRFRDNLTRLQERVAKLISRETGKPIWESRQEVLATIRALHLIIDEGMEALSPRVIEEVTARSDRLARGVVGILTPFCFPLFLHTTHAVTAILAGNSVVVKPSKFTPGVGQAIAEIWDRSGLMRGVYNLVQGPGSVIGQRLVQHPDLDALIYTGSYTTAISIRQQTADRPELPTLLQCGGKGIAIVTDEAEVDRAVYELLVGAYLTAGQRHNSTGRVIVTDGIYDRFVNALVRQASRLVVDYAFEPNTFAGPLISENLRARYRRFARQLAARGHQPLLEAGTLQASRRGYYARPALYRVHWENGYPFLNTEPPGPLLLLYRVSNWQEAAALHNQCSFRLATSIFSQIGSQTTHELQQRLRTGALNINRGTIGASLRLPAGGLGRCSNGVSGGLQLFSFLSHARAQLAENRPFKDLPMLPGTNWHANEHATPGDLELADTDEDDLSNSLELEHD